MLFWYGVYQTLNTLLLKHVANESDADKAIKRFNNYKFMGKEIHVERSTSRLRKQPGMGNKCFTCGAVEHKTSQCPGNGRKRNMFVFFKLNFFFIPCNTFHLLKE